MIKEHFYREQFEQYEVRGHWLFFVFSCMSHSLWRWAEGYWFDVHRYYVLKLHSSVSSWSDRFMMYELQILCRTSGRSGRERSCKLPARLCVPLICASGVSPQFVLPVLTDMCFMQVLCRQRWFCYLLLGSLKSYRSLWLKCCTAESRRNEDSYRTYIFKCSRLILTFFFYKTQLLPPTSTFFLN